jgi:hypothetical protein
VPRRYSKEEFPVYREVLGFNGIYQLLVYADNVKLLSRRINKPTVKVEAEALLEDYSQSKLSMSCLVTTIQGNIEIDSKYLKM